MARADHDWLSFSLMSSMDQMMNIPSSHDHTAADADVDESQHFYSFADNFYANGTPHTPQKKHSYTHLCVYIIQIEFF